jgi:hypothetical protein
LPGVGVPGWLGPSPTSTAIPFCAPLIGSSRIAVMRFPVSVAAPPPSMRTPKPIAPVPVGGAGPLIVKPLIVTPVVPLTWTIAESCECGSVAGAWIVAAIGV